MEDEITLALTFDDVLLVPGKSNVLPSEVNTQTKLTKKINLSIPIISAAMDTVTNSNMAVAMARCGGIGILHRSMDPDSQAEEVRSVKRAESVIISDPVTIDPFTDVNQAKMVMRDHNVSGVPVVEKDGRPIGIITNRDLRLIEDSNKPVTEIMTKELITVPQDITQQKASELMHRHRIEKLLVVDRDGKLAGLMTFKDIEQRATYPNSNKDEKGHLRVGAAVGTDAGVMDRVYKLVDAGVDVIVVDTAHGHSHRVLDTAKQVKAEYPEMQVIAGNIATAEAAQDLIDCGVDGLKVGIGPGSICTTRIVAGVGVPQLSAIANVAKVAGPAGVPVIADGGIKNSGDIAKALAVGADSIMAGSLLAGTKESPGDRILYGGRYYKAYRGMGSIGAMADSASARNRYSQDSVDEFDMESKLVPEGIEGRVPYKGEVSVVLFQLTGGLKASLGYVGAKDIDEFHKKAKLVRISPAGLKESHPHDVQITHESPNYSPDF